MNQKTISLLNQINQRFYQDTAHQFDQKLSYPRHGWTLLLPIINKFQNMNHQIRLLDLACGNAIWADYLSKNTNLKFHYHGIDSNHFLLNQAKQNLQNTPHKLENIDILRNSEWFSLNPSGYSLITIFNFLHHVPSSLVRQKLLLSYAKVLKKNGLLIFTTWQFLKSPKIKKQIINWSHQPQIDQSQLEKHDYLLNWDVQGATSMRYSHHTDQKEEDKIIKTLQTAGLKKISVFSSDSYLKLNRYFIFQKI